MDTPPASNRSGSMPPIVKQPHYVWRFYLEAWETDGQLAAYRQGKTFSSAAKGVAKESGFHNLRDLSETEIEFIRTLMIRKGTPGEDTNNAFIHKITAMQKICRAILDRPTEHTSDVLDAADNIIRNTEEHIQSGLEVAAVPWLTSLRQRDISFIGLPENRLFTYFLAMQYFRTKAMMERMVAAFEDLGDEALTALVERGWQLMRHIMAVNVGGSLYADRRKYRVVFLAREGGVPFIAGAQPIVNTHSTGDIATAPEELEFYYPLSPDLAMLYTPHQHSLDGAEIRVNEVVVDHYNRLILAASPDYFFAHSLTSIKPYADLARNGAALR